MATNNSKSNPAPQAPVEGSAPVKVAAPKRRSVVVESAPLAPGEAIIRCALCGTVGKRAANGSMFGMVRHADVKHGGTWDVEVVREHTPTA